MNFPKNIGMILLSFYLIVAGLSGIFGVQLGQFSILIPMLAVVAGICLLMENRR